MPTPEAHGGHIHLLIPELSDLLVASAETISPELAMALSAVTARAVPAPVSLHCLFAEQAPLAALAWQQDGHSDGHSDDHSDDDSHSDCGGNSNSDEYIVRADPVHLQADMTRVHLLQVTDFALPPAAADALIDSLQPLFAEHAMQLLRGAADAACERWYVRSAQTLPAAWVPPWQALGRPLESSLASSADGRFWLRLQAEAQMLMHAHPLNQQRQQQGLPALNSLWFWGGGSLPPATVRTAAAARWSAACVQSAQLAGYCRWTQIQQWQLDAPGSVLATLPAADHLLLEWRLDRRRSQAENTRALQALLAMLLSDRQQRTLTLQSVAGRCLQLSPVTAWRRLLSGWRNRLPTQQRAAQAHWLRHGYWLANLDASAA